MKQQKRRTQKKSTKLLVKPKLKYDSKKKKSNNLKKNKRRSFFDAIKEKTNKFFTPIGKYVKNSTKKGWDTAKKCSKIVEEKTICFSKKVFFASVKFGLMFSENAQCPNCKTINSPLAHKWENVTNGFNNIGKPAPDFGRRINSYKCKNCNKWYKKKLLKKEPICPRCGSIGCMLESDGDKNYIDEDTVTYESQNINVGFLSDYPWSIRIVDCHQIFYCRKCDLNLWQYQSESRQNCCPYCHEVGKAKKRTFVTDVSTYNKSEIIDGKHMIVAYEHGYETTEYYCPECEEVVYRSGGWYDTRL